MTQTKSKQTSVASPEGREKITVDDTKANVCYASNCMISATSEEVILDFAHSIRPGANGDPSLLLVDTKVFMSPWAAKRLALQLGEVVRNYEGAYGALETDPRKRRV